VIGDEGRELDRVEGAEQVGTQSVDQFRASRF
jgi:hypothetical protein